MGFPKIDINDVMSSVEKQKEFYDLVLDHLDKITGKLSNISIKLGLLVDTFVDLDDETPSIDELAEELDHARDYLFSQEDFLCPADEVLGGNE